jgi:hypothetical protein
MGKPAAPAMSERFTSTDQIEKRIAHSLKNSASGQLQNEEITSRRIFELLQSGMGSLS